MKVSECCGVYPWSNGDNDTIDWGICPKCKEHCQYVDEDDEELEDNWQPCDYCDLPDACEDFGCAIKAGIKREFHG